MRYFVEFQQFIHSLVSIQEKSAQTFSFSGILWPGFFCLRPWMKLQLMASKKNNVCVHLRNGKNMEHKIKAFSLKTCCSYIVCFLIFAAFGFTPQAQEEPTPYDLIRPVWPMSWDSTIIETFVPGVRLNSIPAKKTPDDFNPWTTIPDTLNQAYHDAMNLQISPIRVNQAGYRPQDQKLIYYVGDETQFEVVDSTNSVVGRGLFSPTGENSGSQYTIISAHNAQRDMNIRYTASSEFPSAPVQKGFLPADLPTDQRLRVRVNENYSATFVISERVYSMVRDATLKFMGINRSGDSESWFHAPSHTLDGYAEGRPGELSGGWYDCGDHLKESQTQSYAMMVLAIMAATNPERDEDHYAYNHGQIHTTDGVPDLLREAKHGADFFLKAYDYADGVIDNIPASVGNFGADHGWWGRPENQDLIPESITGRGGPHERDIRRGELGANISAQIAAGLAVLGNMYTPWDSAFAAKSLQVSQELYSFARQLALGQISNVHNTEAAGWSSAAYNGNNEYHDDLALAAVTLLWATRDTSYLYDLAKDPQLAGGQTKQDFINNNGGVGMFRGGWLTHKSASFFKEVKNTSWANNYTYGLYAFYKLILSTEDNAQSYGISSAQRMEYIEDVVTTMAANIGDMSTSGSSETIQLPQGAAMWKQYRAAYHPLWFNMHTDQTWIYNRYQAGNIFDVMAYADVTRDLQNMTFPNLGTPDWKSEEMTQLATNQMSYMLGLNPWDISMLLGVGDKNDAHPHHRAANPEGKNVPGGDYGYTPPTGALFGGVTPGNVSGTDVILPASMSWEDYHISETCIDATVTFISPATLLAKSTDRFRAPEISVEIPYVGYDSAIVVIRQNIYGNATINYGSVESNLSETVSSSEPAVIHTMTLKPLQNGTTYFFNVQADNHVSGNYHIAWQVDSSQTPFSFTTLTSPPAPADIRNVKACDITADSAGIMWFTPNGEYESKIYWDTVLTEPQNMRWSAEGDESGFPTRFHYMRMRGLKEQTTYYYAVESNGQIRSTDESGQPLKFTTPVTQYDFSVRVYQYDWSGMTALSLNIFNNEARAFDSLTVRLYLRGTDEQMLDCNFMIRSDICQAYNEAGFNLPCENDAELRSLLRHALPVKLNDTYNPEDGTYAWYFPVPLGSSVIKSSSRLRFDVMFTRGLSNPGPDGQPVCDELSSATEKTPSPLTDWSWKSHSKAAGDPVDYDGIPVLPKDFGDADLAPINPYVTVYRKDEFVWGYSPSYSEQVTKRANYQLTTTLNAPFNVSNGSHVKLDAASSVFYVSGNAYVTENGEINSIWVNGEEIEDLDQAAVYNSQTDQWDLQIPVRMQIGTNKVDITIFAGPDSDCEECQLTGSCAFTNNTFYVVFSKGDLTASSLVIKESPSGVPVSSPATPGALAFNISVRDDDKIKAGTPSLQVMVLNAQRRDTLFVTLPFDAESGLFSTSSPIQTASQDAGTTGSNTIAFFGGDTVQVIYTDPEDPEDISQQSFFAEATYPVLTSAIALDGNCDGIADSLHLLFNQPFNETHTADSLWVVLKDRNTQAGDSFFIDMAMQPTGNTRIELSLPQRATIPATSAPTGSVSIFIKTQGVDGSDISSVALSDGIPPVLNSVSLLENPEPRFATDTLMIGFSEPVVLSSTNNWPLIVSDLQGNPVNTAGLVLAGEATTKNAGKSWLYAVQNNTDGALIDSGFSVGIHPDFQVVDLALNLLDSDVCQLPVSIAEVPRPVPVNFAAIYDQDENGYPESIHLRFASKLRPKDMLDSFVVHWGVPTRTVSLLPGSSRSWPLQDMVYSRNKILRDSAGIALLGSDSLPLTELVDDTLSTLTLNFAEQIFPMGTTHGHRNGNGSIIPRLGPTGGFFDTEYTLNDSVGPIAIQARIPTDGNIIQTLNVTLSEPVTRQPETSMVIEKRANTQPEPMINEYIDLMLDNTMFSFIYDDETPGAVNSGDYIRLISSPAPAYDYAGNPPPSEAPWIQVKGSGMGKITHQVSMETMMINTNLPDGMTPYEGDPADSEDVFRLYAVHPDEGTQMKIAEGQGNLDVKTGLILDTNSYKHGGPVFYIQVELPDASLTLNGKPVWMYIIEAQLNIYDSQGQFVNRVQFMYDLSMMGIEYVDSESLITFKLEWMNADGATRSVSGRKTGSGVYIGSFDFNSAGYALQDEAPPAGAEEDWIPEYQYGDTRKGSDSKTIRFGIFRGGKE